jgi:hypothetical protein
MAHRLTFLVAALMVSQSVLAHSEGIPGFSPGIWAFPEKPDATAAEIAEACRLSLTIVTPPNDAVTVMFDAIDPPGSVAGKSLRGKITYRESCPPLTDGQLACAGRFPESTDLLPTITVYRVRTLPGGRYEIFTQQKGLDPVPLHPALCPQDVVDGLVKAAIMPKEAGLEP